MPVIQTELDDLLEQWNDHYVSQSRQASCPPGRPNIIYQLSSETGATCICLVLSLYICVIDLILISFLQIERLFCIVVKKQAPFLGGMDCLTNTTEEDEAWLRTFHLSISRSGSDAFDSFAYQKFLSNNWTDATEWRKALYQYVHLIE